MSMSKKFTGIKLVLSAKAADKRSFNANWYVCSLFLRPSQDKQGANFPKNADCK